MRLLTPTRACLLLLFVCFGGSTLASAAPHVPRTFNGLRTRQEKALTFFGFERLSDAYWYRDVLNPQEAEPGYLPEAGMKRLRFGEETTQPEAPYWPPPSLERPGFFPEEPEAADAPLAPGSVNPFPDDGPIFGLGPESTSDFSIAENPFTGPEPATGVLPGTFRVSEGPPMPTDLPQDFQTYQGNYGFVDPEEFLILFERQVELPRQGVETAKVPFAVPLGAGPASAPATSSATYERE
ncbi:MAG: hypothetical protein ACFBZ8_07670 [Opitutales bacterium]